MATKPVAKYPMIIRTTSQDDLPYADDEAGVELVPLATEADIANLLLDAQKLSLPRRSSTRSVKNRRGSSPDMKFIEDDESDSELVALAGIDSRESSSVPRGDNLPEYDVEELKNLLLCSPSSGWIRTQSPPDCNPDKKESLTDDKTDPIVVNILNHSPSAKRKSRHEYEKLTIPASSERDSLNDSTYCTIRDDAGGTTRVSSTSSSTVQPSPSKSRSGTPENASSSRRRAQGEGEGFLGRRLHSNVSVEHKEEEEQILEVLRQAVRKCTNPDPRKRPASTDIFDMLSFCGTNRDHSP